MNHNLNSLLISFCAWICLLTGSVALAEECEETAVPWGVLTVRSLDQAHAVFTRVSTDVPSPELNVISNRIALIRSLPGVDPGRPLVLNVSLPTAKVNHPIWTASIPVLDAKLLISSIKHLSSVQLTDLAGNRWLIQGHRGEMTAIALQNRLLVSNVPTAFDCQSAAEELSREPVVDSDLSLRIQRKGIPDKILEEVNQTIRSILNRLSGVQAQKLESDTRLEVATLVFLKQGMTRWVPSIDWIEAKVNLGRLVDVDVRVQTIPGSDMERDLKKLAPESSLFFRPSQHPVAAHLSLAGNLPGQVRDLLAIAFEQVRDKVSNGMKMTLHPKDQEAAVGGFQTIVSTISSGRLESHLELVPQSNGRMMSIGSIRAQRTDLMAKSLSTVLPLAAKAGDLRDVTLDVVKQGEMRVHRVRARKYRPHDILFYGPDPFVLVGTNPEHYFFVFGGQQPEAAVLSLKNEVVVAPDLVSASFHLRPWLRLLEAAAPDEKNVARLAALFPADSTTRTADDVTGSLDESLQLKLRAESNQLRFHLQADTNLLKLARLLKD